MEKINLHNLSRECWGARNILLKLEKLNVISLTPPKVLATEGLNSKKGDKLWNICLIKSIIYDKEVAAAVLLENKNLWYHYDFYKIGNKVYKTIVFTANKENDSDIHLK